MNNFYLNYRENQKISVYESAGKGQAVVFVHGNSLGAESFFPILESSLGKELHFVAFDFFGHGGTGTSANPNEDYTPQGLINCLLFVKEQMKLEEAVFVGHSLGGHIILQAANQLQSAKGFVIFGTPPLSFPLNPAVVYLPNPALGLAFKGELTEVELFQLASSFTYSVKNTDFIISLIKKTDASFRTVIANAIFAGGLLDETEIIKNISKPVAIFHGEFEELINLDYIRSLLIPKLWKNSVQVISGAGHCPQLENSEEFNRLMELFLSQIS